MYKTDDNLNTEIIIDNFEGKKFNSPNDLCVKSDGTIFFTDPPYGILSDYEGYTAAKNMVHVMFLLSSRKKKLSVVIDDLDRPNGITLSPDEKKLYVADTVKILNTYIL